MRENLDQLADSVLRPAEGERLQAFANQADDDDFGRDQWFADKERGDHRQGEGQVDAEPAVEQPAESAIEDAGTAKHGRQCGEAKPKKLTAETWNGTAEKPTGQARQQIERN